MTRTHYIQIYDHEWFRPYMRGWKSKCCKCGLVHKMDFRVVKVRGVLKVEVRAVRLRSRAKKK